MCLFSISYFLYLQSVNQLLTPSVPDGVLWGNAPTSLPLPRAEAVMVALGEEVQDMVSRCVEGKGHQECIEKVKAVVANFDQPLQ